MSHWTGKQVFNLIIPKQINLLRYSAWHNDSEKGYITPGDTQVRIEKGELLSGTLCKKTLGTSTGSLIHVIWEEVGPDAAQIEKISLKYAIKALEMPLCLFI